MFEDLETVPLDAPTIARGVVQLGLDFEKLAPHFSTLSKMEADLAQGTRSAEEIEAETKHFLDAVAENAHRAMFEKTLFTPQERRELEGYRILLGRGEKLAKRAQYLRSDEGKEDLEEMLAEAKKLKKEIEKKTERQAKPSQSEKSSSNAKDPKNASIAKEPQSSGGREQPYRRHPQQQSTPSRPQEAPNNAQGAAAQGQNEQVYSQGARQGKPSAQSSDFGAQPMSPSSPSSAAGKESGGHSVTESLGEQSGQSQVQFVTTPSKITDDSQPKKKGFSKSRWSTIKGDGKKTDSAETKQDEEAARKSKDKKDQSGNPERASGKNKAKGAENPETEPSSAKNASPQKALPQIDDRLPLVLKKHLENLWAQAMRSHGSSSRLLNSIVEYMRYCEGLEAQHLNMAFIKQFRSMAQSAFETLEGTKLHYKNIEDVALQLVSTSRGDIKATKLFLEFLKRIFSEIRSVDQLTSDEEAADCHVRALLGRIVGDNSRPDDAAVIEAFIKQLVGPLSRTAVKREFGTDQGFDERRISDAIERGRLNDYLIMARLKPYLRVSLQETRVPMSSVKHTGSRIPMSDADPGLEQAEDFQNRLRFHRDGPVGRDLQRLAAEDLFEKTYREPVVTENPVETKPHIADIILWDFSGSINYNRKNIVETYLLASYIDESQITVAQNKARRTIYSIPFNDRPHAAEKLVNLNQAQGYFDKLRGSPVTTNGETNITAAVVKAYQTIGESQKAGGDLRRANILLITDGADQIQMDEILRARAALDPKIEITLNVISLGDGNPDLRNLATNTERAAKLGRYSYQHITYEEIGRILDEKLRIQFVKSQASMLHVGEKPGALNSYDIQKLKQSLTRVESEKNLKVVRVLDQKKLQDILMDEASDDSNSSWLVGNSDRMIAPLLGSLASNINADSTSSQKFGIASRYLNAAAAELGEPLEDFISTLSRDSRERLMHLIWSGKQ